MESRDLFNEPAPNSRDDLGFGPAPEPSEDPRPRETFGKKKRAPKETTNAAPNAIQWADARKLVAWIVEQDVPTHVNVTTAHCLVELSGLTTIDLKWICQAIKQVGKAPRPVVMKRAAVARDVAIMRSSPIDEPKASK